MHSSFPSDLKKTTAVVESMSTISTRCSVTEITSLLQDIIWTFLLLQMHYQNNIKKLDGKNSYGNHVIKNWKMANTARISKIVQILICLGSNVNHDQDSQDNVQQCRTQNENNITYDFPAQYTTQSTTLTNYCLCTCCHKTDVQRSQCIIFKQSKYNFDNAVVVQALSNRFSIPTSKEYICKKCNKDFLGEVMPLNSVASHMRLTSNEPQQMCIHCKTVPTDKFLTLDKTKYGQNTNVSQMKEKWWTKTSYVTSVTMQFVGNPLLHVSHAWKLWKNVYIEIWYEQILLTGKQHTRNQNHRDPTLTYVRSAMYNCNKKITFVCCNRHMQKHVCKMYNKSRLWHHKFCCITMLRTCIKFHTWRAIYMCIMWQKTKRNKCARAWLTHWNND